MPMSSSSNNTSSPPLKGVEGKLVQTHGACVNLLIQKSYISEVRFMKFMLFLGFYQHEREDLICKRGGLLSIPNFNTSLMFCYIFCID